MMTAATILFVWGWIAHLVADILLQNTWMSDTKGSLRHPAAWVHGTVHLVAALCVFPPLVAIPLALAHVLIDTRRPLVWWRRVYRQSTVVATSHPALHAFAFFEDQVAHVVCLAIAAVIVAH